MNHIEAAERWGMPFEELLRNLAACGLSTRDAGKVVGMSRDHMRTLANQRGVSHLFETSCRLSDISVRFREPAWDLIARLADFGMGRGEVAAITGYNHGRFQQVLKDHPDKDPFKPWEVASTYLRDTGETVVAAARRLAAMGLTAEAAGKAVGYVNGAGLKQALAARGVVVEFARAPSAKAKPEKARPWVEKGGPKGPGLRGAIRKDYQKWAANNERV